MGVEKVDWILFFMNRWILLRMAGILKVVWIGDAMVYTPAVGDSDGSSRNSRNYKMSLHFSVPD
jgi:hypothetical protein